MTMYLTSDPHLGHKKVSEIRGYTTTASHDADIVKAWRVVNSEDHVWVLGDLAASSPTYALGIIKGLPGHKHLITGNHDTCSPIHSAGYKALPQYLEVFETVQAYAKRSVKVNCVKKPVLMSHYPYSLASKDLSADHTDEERYTQFRLPDLGDWLLHGHTHSTEKRQYPHSIHVGWDAWKRLVSWDEIRQIIIEENNGV